MTLRQGHLSDLPYLYDICHKTGYIGGDASSVVSDKFLLGHYFAAPYLVRDAAWCWVAADADGPVGYLVTTPTSPAFCHWMNADWLPRIRTLAPRRPGPQRSPFESWLRDLIHEPATVPDFVAEYPAHFHIDFLPGAQGKGLGSQILALFLERAKTAGVAGVHLGVGVENVRAQGFYAQQGFHILRKDPGVIYLGLELDH